ncbi:MULTISPECIES: hypothetical protein [unclassified Anabaena]|uniref:hypothetical protein n=1 Tax=unclassified Anabaena TaxID=2619674 RepID=UPI0014483795|nr:MULTISPECIES: hypothetical protein [unclassified Anabaena]MTJ07573.1 hypothetical protein [Anabaena sp. UHCC 0204]MTJ51458.1 hypothetical protein [Anabaena sp. UHCC 0253]
MAPKNNLLGDIFSSSPNFLSQLLFGLFLFIIARSAGASFPVSLFVGVMGGVSLGLFTAANENNPESTTVASNDGIDAGLKYWLVFMLGCLFLGYSAPISILFGGIAGVGGGWIIAWWRCQETLQTQLPEEILEEEIPSDRSAKRRKRKPTKRFRRESSTFNFRFWNK